jgi:FdhD protein
MESENLTPPRSEHQPSAVGVLPISMQRIEGLTRTKCNDFLAVEEPLEIRLGYGPSERRVRSSVSITMRTPGADIELALGFLLSEGIIRTLNDVKMTSVGFEERDKNTVTVDLHSEVIFDLKRLERHFYTTSSCGVCGKASLAALYATQCDRTESIEPQVPLFTNEFLTCLPERLKIAQSVFSKTGGLHASALFAGDGEMVMLQEDVGRHNALDKVLGAMLLAKQMPLNRHLLLLSGRVSFELVQKASMAGLRVLAALGAPSSLAIDLAKEKNMTVIGFLRPERFNLYCGSERIV